MKLSTPRWALAALALAAYAPAAVAQASLADQVEIRRTAYGVPHIRAENFRAAGFGLGWVQLEDHGMRIVHGLVRARGELALRYGADSLDSDFGFRPVHRRAVATYPLLEADTRDMYDGFAAGVNRYVELHRSEFPGWVTPTFSGHDVHAQGMGGGGPDVRRFLNRVHGESRGGAGQSGAEGDPQAPGAEDGSNAWALAPSRTRSGRAILLRNPHLAWSAGYYEAHVTVPGQLDFYGDFRLGGPIVLVGGFNAYLGWATTNNAPDLEEIYALEVDPARPDHYLFDGGSVPLRRETETVEFANGPGVGTVTREGWTTPLGPVIHRGGGKIYVVRAAGEDEFRGGEQFLKMMRARNRTEWTNAVRMRARVTSNLTYADRDGNIYYVWNATHPALPHPSGGDTAAIPATRSTDVWTRVVAFDSLPQVLNPRGGYVRNENDPPYLTNLHQPLRREDYPAYFPGGAELRLRSQHSLELLHNDRKFSLEDVVATKHSMRMILADRVKDDLLRAVRATQPTPEVAQAAAVLERWDNTAAAESRGGVLFETWWWRYVRTGPQAPPSAASVGFPVPAAALFAQAWTAAEPLATPRGLGDPARAAEAFAWAVAEVQRKYESTDVAWGTVHRVRHGSVDVPVGGCSGFLGCFRVLNFREEPDGTRTVVGGDGWVLAVEFTTPVRAYSVLAYGESSRPGSPHHDDQAAMFAANRMKPVAFTEADVERATVRRYRPGREPAGSR